MGSFNFVLLSNYTEFTLLSRNLAINSLEGVLARAPVFNTSFLLFVRITDRFLLTKIGTGFNLD